MRSLLSLPFRQAKEPLELEESPYKSYRRFRFKTPQPSATDIYLSAASQRFGASGNHIYIHKINGPGIIQVRCNVDNPWIDVAEGMTISREFSEFYVRDAYNYSANLIHLTEVIIYTSYGPAIYMPFKTHGFKPTPFVNNTVLAANTWVTLEVMIGGAGSLQEFAGDLTGGAFLLRISQNAPSGAQLRYVQLPAPAYAAGNGYQLFPGEWLSVELDSKIGRMSGDLASPLNRWAWVISPNTAGLTTTVNYIIGTRNDLSDIDYGSDVNLTRVLEMG